nr:putative reverse transcriptase domain-containing protein [Tanacetum cinerariifolium]
MEVGIATYINKCLTCLRMRDEYQKPTGLLVQSEMPIGKKLWPCILSQDYKRKQAVRHYLGNYDHQKELCQPKTQTLRISNRRKGHVEGTVAYRLELPEQLSRVHSTFHVSNLKKCLSDEPLAIPLDEIQVDDKLHFIEEHVEIMDREVKRLKQSRIPIVKVRWNSRRGPEFTWEREDQMQKKYPHLFLNSAPVADATS